MFSNNCNGFKRLWPILQNVPALDTVCRAAGVPRRPVPGFSAFAARRGPCGVMNGPFHAMTGPGAREKAPSPGGRMVTPKRFAETCALGDGARMKIVTRLLSSLVLAVALLATTISQPAAALTAEMAMAAMPCCDDGCPQDMDCDMPCMAMMRCATATMGFVPPSPPAMLHLAATANVPEAGPPWQLGERAPDGLKRPPRL